MVKSYQLIRYHFDLEKHKTEEKPTVQQGLNEEHSADGTKINQQTYFGEDRILRSFFLIRLLCYWLS